MYNLIRRTFLFVFIIFGSANVFGGTKTVIEYEYKNYTKIDLSELSIKGKIVTPTDLTVNNTDFAIIREELWERTNFHHDILPFENRYQK
jgi:hypothetical protein